MKVTVDTNILIRAAVRDDKKQARAAARLLRNAETIAVTLPCLCEFVWVLRRVYAFARPDIASAIVALLNSHNVQVNRPAVEAGLAILNSGGDFADGVIAYEGNWMSGGSFVSFDSKAISIITKLGQQARLLH